MRREYWVYLPSFELSICAPPKCGSRALLYALVNHFYGPVDYQEVRPSEWCGQLEHFSFMTSPRNGEKVAFVRHPLDRFKSLYAHHCRDGYPGVPHEYRGGSVERLIKLISIRPNADPHWATQKSVIGDLAGVNLVSISYAAIWLKNRTGIDMAVVNKTAAGAIDINEDQEQRILAHYAEDMELVR